MDAKEYRAAIRPLWLPHVGRKILKKYEIQYIEACRRAEIPVQVMARAIEETCQRVRTVYSIGIIRYSLEACMKEYRRSQVGASMKADEDVIDMDWRSRMKNDLEFIRDTTSSEARYRATLILLGELPSLTEEGAIRWMEALPK